MKSWLNRAVLLAGFVLALVGCGSGGGGDSTTTPGKVTYTMAINSASPDVVAGSTVALTVLITASDGSVVNTSVDMSSDCGVVSPSKIVVSGGSGTGSYAPIITCLGAHSVTGTTTIGSSTVVATKSINVQTAVASITMLTDKSQLGSSGVEHATLTAILKDSNNNVLKGIPVVFTADSGSVVTTQNVSDASGQAITTLYVGDDFSNRQITVTATPVGASLSATRIVNVVGTTLSLQGSAALVLGSTSQYTVTLLNSDGRPIVDQDIVLKSALNNSLSQTTVHTNLSGNAVVTLTANNGGNEVLTGTALSSTVTGTFNVAISIDSFLLTKTAPAGDIPLNTNGSVKLVWKQGNVAQQAKAVILTTTRGGFNGTTATSINAVTDANGTVTATINATNAGFAIVSAKAASGPSADLQVEFVATVPSRIDLSATPTTVGPNQQQSTITALVQDVNGNLVKSKTVDFSLDDVRGGTLLRGSAVTDSSGLATTVYTSNVSTAQNGVHITGTVNGTAIQDEVDLTVAERNLFVKFGTDNTLYEVPDQPTAYAMKFFLFVNDANGKPVPNQTVTISAIPTPYDILRDANPTFPVPFTGYMKGYYIFVAQACGGTDCYVPNFTAFSTYKVDGVDTAFAGCLSEDKNRDGVLQVGEDFNLDGRLTPGNVLAAPGTVVTGADGKAEFEVQYAKQFGNWTRMYLKASTNVSGTETFDAINILLPVAREDVVPPKVPPGITTDVPGLGTVIASPFGVATSCVKAN